MAGAFVLQMRALLREVTPRFEEWAHDNGYSVDRIEAGNPDSKYKSETTQAAFEGWIGALFYQAGD